MRGASGGAFVEGPVTFLGAQFAALPVSVTAGAGVETPVLSLRANNVYLNRQSTAQLQIDRISVACDGTKTVLFKVYKNSTLTAPRWQYVNATTSAAAYDQNATGFSAGNGTLVYAFAVAKTGNSTESLTDPKKFRRQKPTRRSRPPPRTPRPRLSRRLLPRLPRWSRPPR